MRALTLAKRVGETPATILTEARNGFERGIKREGWALYFYRKGSILLAKLSVEGRTPIVGLDHHAVPGEIAIGYHWDVYPPIAADKRRIHLEPQPSNEVEALRFLCTLWNVVLDDSQGDMFG